MQQLLVRRAGAGLPQVRRLARRSTSFNSNGYGLSDEQRALRDMAESFAEKEMAPHAQKWDREKLFPADTLRRAAALGFGGMFVREESGGTGLSRFEGSLVYEALAGACASTTAYISIHNMCAWMVDRFGTEQQRRRWLPRLISMEWFSSYCLTEPGSGSDAQSLRTSARREGDSYVLNGSKAFISGGGRSELYLVMARAPEGITCFAVEAASTPGMTFGAQEHKMGWNSQPTCAVNFEDARVPADAVLGGLGQGFKVAMKGLDGGRLSIAACSVGAARACYNVARSHVQLREQFGKPLAANQTIQFRLAQMGCDIHSARLMVRHAATLLDAGDANATVHCAMAKREATDRGFKVCDEALQLLGGYGYLQDYPVERLQRDARVHRILEGTNEVQLMILSRAALAEA
jgi:alkylation response protein AidB-like acyl-CoA dehydrogenase